MSLWFKREEKRKATFRMEENETEIYFVLMKNVKAIPWEFQHALMVADIDKKKIRNVVRKICTKRRKISLLKNLKIRK